MYEYRVCNHDRIFRPDPCLELSSFVECFSTPPWQFLAHAGEGFRSIALARETVLYKLEPNAPAYKVSRSTFATILTLTLLQKLSLT